MSLFEKFEFSAEMDERFDGNVKELPWHIAARYFKVPFGELLYVESGDLKFFPGWSEEQELNCIEWEEFNDELKRDGKVLEKFDIGQGKADIIGLGDERFFRFRHLGILSYYTI